MLALLIATMLISPVYPLNPLAQDTVAPMNLHLSAGFNGPTNLVSGGPEIAASYEYLFKHPFILRASLGYRQGRMYSSKYPEGNLNRLAVGADLLYYKGTDDLSACVGLGFVYSLTSLSTSGTVADSLYAEKGIDDVWIGNYPGYRITLGLRYHRSYSLEVRVQEARSRLHLNRTLSPSSYSDTSEKLRLNDMGVMVGYLFQLK